jgi:hypothetical protein
MAIYTLYTQGLRFVESHAKIRLDWGTRHSLRTRP